MDSLADALPELEAGEGGSAELKGKIRHKSLKSKKGALKRKERVVKGEMERFGVSMARLTGTPEERKRVKTPAGIRGHDDEAEMDGQEDQTVEKTAPAQAAPATANRWAALRGYISATMEQNPAFEGKN